MGSHSVGLLKAADDNDQGESSFVSKNEGIAGSEVVIIENDLFDQGVNVAEELGRKRGSEPIPDPFVPEAYSGHNVLSGLHCPSFQNKLNALSFDDLADVYDVHALHLAMVGNMLTNESRIVPWDLFKLKDDFVSLRNSQVVKDLRAKGKRLSEELFVFKDVAKSSKDSRKVLAKEVERLRPIVSEASLRGEIKALTDRLKVVDLERIELVKDFIPLAVRKLMASDQFNWEMGRLQQKAMIFGKAKKIFDEAVEAFDKLEFPYIIPFEECGKKSQRSCHY
nr:hypothetical protein [Tanacetum cinerariifolium]